jgi:hypothetical protein
MGSSLIVSPTDIVCGDVLVAGGNLNLQGEVRGSVQVLGGNADVSGVVTGDITVIGGNLTLQPGATVSGVAHEIGGSLTVASGAHLAGTGPNLGEPADIARAPGLNLSVDAGSFWLSLLFWLSAAIGLSAVAPEMVGRVRYTISHHVALSGVMGVISGFVALVGAVILVITCIGIPLALLIAVAAWFAWVVGTVGLAAWLGSVVFGGPRHSPSLIVSSTLGVLALSLLKELPVAGPIIGVLAGMVAVGGATLTMLSARRYPYGHVSKR